jgi:hypothetical protein
LVTFYSFQPTISFFFSFLLGYIHCTGGFIPPTNLLPTPLKAIARGFFVLFHIDIWSPSTIFPHLHLLLSPSPSHM